VYDDVELPYPDATVAEKLCIGGACYYLFQNEDANNLNGIVDETIGKHIDMMKTFILSAVVPNICNQLPESCALVLGKALLWFIYCNDPVTNNFLPEIFRNQVKSELSDLLTALGSPIVNENFNPIRRVPVVVSSDQGSVFIDTIEEFVDDAIATVAGVGGGGRPAAGGIHAQFCW
jgi:hypothetical protein